MWLSGNSYFLSTLSIALLSGFFTDNLVQCDMMAKKKHWVEQVCGGTKHGNWCVPSISGFNGYMNCENRAMTHCPIGTECRMYGKGAAACVAVLPDTTSSSGSTSSSSCPMYGKPMNPWFLVDSSTDSSSPSSNSKSSESPSYSSSTSSDSTSSYSSSDSSSSDSSESSSSSYSSSSSSDSSSSTDSSSSSTSSTLPGPSVNGTVTDPSQTLQTGSNSSSPSSSSTSSDSTSSSSSSDSTSYSSSSDSSSYSSSSDSSSYSSSSDSSTDSSNSDDSDSSSYSYEDNSSTERSSNTDSESSSVTPNFSSYGPQDASDLHHILGHSSDSDSFSGRPSQHGPSPPNSSGSNSNISWQRPPYPPRPPRPSKPTCFNTQIRAVTLENTRVFVSGCLTSMYVSPTNKLISYATQTVTPLVISSARQTVVVTNPSAVVATSHVGQTITVSLPNPHSHHDDVATVTEYGTNTVTRTVPQLKTQYSPVVIISLATSVVDLYTTKVIVSSNPITSVAIFTVTSATSSVVNYTATSVGRVTDVEQVIVTVTPIYSQTSLVTVPALLSTSSTVVLPVTLESTSVVKATSNVQVTQSAVLTKAVSSTYEFSSKMTKTKTQSSIISISTRIKPDNSQ